MAAVDTMLDAGMVTLASGSVGDTTVYMRHGRLIRRARVTPAYPATVRQKNAHATVAFLHGRWLALSTAARQRWAVYGRSLSLTGLLGDRRPLAGWQAYLYVNFHRSAYAFTRVDVAPPYAKAATLGDVSAIVQATAPRIKVTFDTSDAWVSENNAGMIVFGSASWPTSINWFRGPYRQAVIIRGSSSSPPTSPTSGSSGAFFLTSGDHWFGRAVMFRADGSRAPDRFIGPLVIG